MERELIIFIGMQASGKSTFFNQRLANAEYVYVNLDTLKSRRREMSVFLSSLANGLCVVVDNTNLTQADRQRYITQAKTCDYKVIGYFFQSRLKDCIERNNNRDRVVPIKALTHASRIMELPSMSEGFDELNFVRITEIGFEVSPWIEENK